MFLVTFIISYLNSSTPSWSNLIITSLSFIAGVTVVQQLGVKLCSNPIGFGAKSSTVASNLTNILPSDLFGL